MSTTEAVSALEQVLAQIPSSEYPQVLGELERLRASIWVKVLNVQPANVSQQEQPLLTVPQVAERLNIPVTRVYEMIRQGKLPARHIGKYVRVDPAELAKWMAQRSE